MSRRKQTGRGVLFVIAALLAASGLVRLGGPAGHAIAREVSNRGVDNVPPPLACDPASPEISDAILAELIDREKRVDETETRQRETEHTLRVARAEIEERLTDMRAAEESLRATMALAETAAESDLARLTAVYENMKPKDAAGLFEQMSPDFAAGFMGMMRPDAAAQIMAALDPATAYSISVVLAGRNARAASE
ncbi:MotE family protein [Actibacterium sp. XHP0104]|uniref:MotE family protein n=1 Tax=Actibacterium sp. XHP0104 TaxID=2984335 RepID=UPI0021E6EC08|nr:hypothetical protein [Actibacterium sp. XHP0104]MCV2881815.1 hypothetical protein [Actibacterium sp. XHP0104]